MNNRKGMCERSRTFENVRTVTRMNAQTGMMIVIDDILHTVIYNVCLQTITIYAFASRAFACFRNNWM